MNKKLFLFGSLFVLTMLIACKDKTPPPPDDGGKGPVITTPQISVGDSIDITVLEISDQSVHIPSVTIYSTVRGKKTFVGETFENGTAMLKNVSSTNLYELATEGYYPLNVKFITPGDMSNVKLYMKDSTSNIGPDIVVMGVINGEGTGPINNAQVTCNGESTTTGTNGKFMLNPTASNEYIIEATFMTHSASISLTAQDTAIISLDIDGVTPYPDDDDN